MKSWNYIPIIDSKEKLVVIPGVFKFIKPHPYFCLGAPYDSENMWKLREAVVNKLISVNEYLKSKDNNLCLLIYDAWRPIKVQEFMFRRAFALESEKLNIETSGKDMNSYPLILKKVERFWAYPSSDEKCPPPHSTGGALDVTFSDKDGNLVEMGGNIDQMDESSKPDFYNKIDNQEAIIWNKRRILLKEIMIKFGFVQHPNEWWHFSYGDQLWAWKKKKENAFYGKY